MKPKTTSKPQAAAPATKGWGFKTWDGQVAPRAEPTRAAARAFVKRSNRRVVQDATVIPVLIVELPR